MRWRAPLLVSLLVGCAGARLPRVPGDPAPAAANETLERQYQLELERFTRQQAVYDHLDTRLFVQATWQAPRFVSARLSRVAAFKAIPPGELVTQQEAEAKRLADVTEFFVAVHANDARFDDFDRPNSMWRIALVANGVEATPLSIERLGRSNIEMRSVYSYMESFWVGYRVRFPKVDLGPGGTMMVRVASAVGRAELQFSEPE